MVFQIVKYISLFLAIFCTIDNYYNLKYEQPIKNIIVRIQALGITLFIILQFLV